MKKLVTTAIFAMAIMMSVNFASAQKGGTPPTNPGVFVSIPLNGCICPTSGTVTSLWWWVQPGTTNYKQCGGTLFYYDDIPASGWTYSSQTYPGYVVHQTQITIIPNTVGGVGINTKWADGGVCVIRPSSCCPPGQDCGCRDDNFTE